MRTSRPNRRGSLAGTAGACKAGDGRGTGRGGPGRGPGLGDALTGAVPSGWPSDWPVWGSSLVMDLTYPLRGAPARLPR